MGLCRYSAVLCLQKQGSRNKSPLLQSYDTDTNYTGFLSLRTIFRGNMVVESGCETGNCAKRLLLSWVFCLKYWLHTLEAESSSTVVQQNRWQWNITPIYTKHRMLQDYSSSPQPKADPPPKGKAPHFRGETSERICLQNAHVNYISNEGTSLSWLCIPDTQVLPAPQDHRHKREVWDTS